ncbi:hypothetical protein RB653_003660 [Dictyostelium firmibasis]|uniref:Uncharacterized protein n=1 Tax=Dictyostelium firmibasis TaxID=79012 RepID=A0AAN7TZK0_9MYCE
MKDLSIGGLIKNEINYYFHLIFYFDILLPIYYNKYIYQCKR